MKTNRRKDNSGRVLKEGEYQRTSGTYEFKWRDKRGNRHSISAPTLEELRDKELDALRDVLNGVSTDKENLTINDLFNSWIRLKRGLKELKKVRNTDTKKRRALTIPEQELFEEFLSKNGPFHRWYPIFTVMLWTGMRVGEVTGLRWEDIDLEKETISVNHTLVYYSSHTERGQVFAINTPKTKAGERVIPMLPKVKEAFLLERKFQEELEIKSEATIDGYRDFIFVNRFGNVQHQGTLNKELRRIIRDCNLEILEQNDKEDVLLLPKFSNHSLRHTFTTGMCEAGVNIKAMQDILGHADIETTMDIYAEATKELKRSELVNFEEYFAKQKRAQLKVL